MDRRALEGSGFFVAFVACVPSANWLIGHVGTGCVPNGPCVISVAPGVLAPSGVLMIGLALVLRDLVQRRLGKLWAVVAILIGAVISGAVAPPALVAASASAFLLSELADFAVYTPLQQRRLLTAVLASSFVGLAIDSVVVLYLAFGSLEFLLGQVLGKGWMVLLALPAVWWLRDRDRRLGLGPA
jgi:uncharacterized PurR-regulated membrane protein YhhQ (DUF165 family)